MKTGPVLFVEDDPNDVALTTMALEESGFKREIVIAGDGEEASRLLFDDPAFDPAVVLLDLNLPKIGGLELLAALRADKRRRDLPVIILTSSDEPSDRARAKAAGANAYLLKPSSWEGYAEIAAELQKHLDSPKG